MRLIRGLRHLHMPETGCVATIGNFDGVHLGHRKLVENLAAHGQSLGLPVVVVLFEPQPREYFDPHRAPARLTRLREKLVRLAELPVDFVLLLRFDRALASCSPDQFIEDILIQGLKVRYLVVGDDFRFGRGRRGDLATLRSFGRRAGFQVADTESVQVDGERVSSTGVREALAGGDLKRAERLLGRPYSVCGRVVYGAQRGRAFGFPTANVALWRRKTPLHGVFAVTMAGVGDRPRPGVANVGMRPTVEGTPTVLLETYLFDFKGNIYGRPVEVFFHHKLRDEKRFDSLAELIEQIGKDAENAKAFLAAIE